MVLYWSNSLEHGLVAARGLADRCRCCMWVKWKTSRLWSFIRAFRAGSVFSLPGWALMTLRCEKMQLQVGGAQAVTAVFINFDFVCVLGGKRVFVCIGELFWVLRDHKMWFGMDLGHVAFWWVVGQEVGNMLEGCGSSCGLAGWNPPPGSVYLELHWIRPWTIHFP